MDKKINEVSESLKGAVDELLQLITDISNQLAKLQDSPAKEKPKNKPKGRGRGRGKSKKKTESKPDLDQMVADITAKCRKISEQVDDKTGCLEQIKELIQQVGSDTMDLDNASLKDLDEKALTKLDKELDNFEYTEDNNSDDEDDFDL